jgi:putative phosphoribosyl transferase
MFKDRRDAGIQLAERLTHYKDKDNLLVLALPRGGVVPGFEVAKALNAPLDVLIVRKIGFPGQPEFAIGAVAETGAVSMNRSIVERYNVSGDYIEEETARKKEEIARRVEMYRGGRSIEKLGGRTVILVDDGVATGATMKAGIAALKKEKIDKLVIALPVAPPSTADELGNMADEVICLETPEDFAAVGGYYYDFTQVTDDEVVAMLNEASGFSSSGKRIT